MQAQTNLLALRSQNITGLGGNTKTSHLSLLTRFYQENKVLKLPLIQNTTYIHTLVENILLIAVMYLSS